MKRIKKLTEIAIIFWQDATMHDTEQRTKDEWLKKVHLIKGCAIGHILQEDKEKITLAMDMFYSEGIDFRQVATYPKSGIKQIIRKQIKY